MIVKVDTARLSKSIASAKRRVRRMAQAKVNVSVTIVSDRDGAEEALDKLREKNARFLTQQQLGAITEEAQRAAVDSIVSAWNGQGSDSWREMALIGERTLKLLKRRFAAGRVGTNTARYSRRKARAAKAGKMTTAYGDPPPFGVATGRLVDRMRVVVRRG